MAAAEARNEVVTIFGLWLIGPADGNKTMTLSFWGMSFGVNVGSVLVLSSLLFSPPVFSYAFTSLFDMPPSFHFQSELGLLGRRYHRLCLP